MWLFFSRGFFSSRSGEKKGKNIQLLLPAPYTLIPFTDKSTLLWSDINLLLFPSLFPPPPKLNYWPRNKRKETGWEG